MNVYLSMVLCLFLGIIIGMWQGFWIAYVRIPAFIVTLSGMLVFRGLTLLVLNGMTLSPFPPNYLMFFTGFIAKEAKIVLLGMDINIVCLITGVAVALIFCGMQIINNRSRRRKGYETESGLALTIKMLVISAALIWFFTLLAQYQGIPVRAGNAGGSAHRIQLLYHQDGRRPTYLRAWRKRKGCQTIGY